MIFEKAKNKDVMALYAAIADQSANMLRSAQEGDWDALCASEEQCSKLIHQLQKLKQNAAKLDASEKQEHIGYLKQILADDAAIRNITEPRLMQLEQFLRAASNNQRLNKSYGSN